MKTKISRIGKKSLSVIIVTMMIVSTMLVGMVSVSASITGYSAIYFTPGSNWRQANAIFKLEVDSNKIDFVCVDETNHVYKATLDSNTTYNNLKFLRINPDNTSQTWDYSNTFSWISDDKSLNHYKMNDSLWNSWDVNTTNGTWSAYSGSSTTYSISKGTATNGTFTVSPESAAEGATVTVNTTPNSGYEVDKVTYTYGTTTANATGSGNSYTFQMPAANVTVNVTFKQTSTSTEKTVYFKNTAGWPTVMCYAWDNNDTPTDGNWHGKAMTKVDGTDDVYTVTLSSNAVYCIFNDNGSTQTGNLTIQEGKIFIYDTSYTTDQGYWDDYGSTPTGDYKLADKSGNYGKVVFTVGGKVVTAANENDEVTATVTPNTGFEYVADSFSVTNDTSKEAVGTPTGTTLTFTMPASNVTATAKFALNKAEYVKTLEDGLYVDVAPDKNDTTATFVMWNNYTGVGQNAPSSGYAAHNTKGYYTLYIPANVDLGSVTLYNAFSSDVKINGQTVPADGSKTVSLTETTYSADSNNTYKVQVLKGSTSSMFLYTNDGKGNDYDLPTSKKSYSGLLDKETVKASGGLCTTIKGSTVSDALDLSQVKGRGNSSWEASALLFGKYAFNMKLSSATSLFGLPKSKSFCLLANNMDDALMRNAYVYQLAKDIGLYDSPEFEFVDIYDNGEYMGAYLVTEKVDVADKNKLIKGNSIDDLNEKAGAVFDETNKKQGYADITNRVDLDGNAEFVNKYQTTGTYLLEFEIDERYQDEISWFISNQGQHVVLKSPEFATKGEVEFIKNKFNAMEALVYADTINLEALSKVMDLDSFARMYLIQEFTSNLDSAATSYYITYDCSKGLFVASPVWDYDWALGQNSGTKKAKDGSDLSANNAEAWFAKNKAMGKGDATGKYSLQSKLATDSNFQTVIKKVWFGKNNDGFYNKVQAYYTDGGQLDTWKNQISKSVSMNEERWGFIANNPARSSWGSPDTTGGNGFTGAVNYLKTTWSSKRGTWLNNEFNKYSNYSQIATPTLTAYAADGTTPLEGEVTAGDTYVLKADTSEIYVDYVLYDGSTEVETNTNGVFTINNATSGTHSYTVKTVYNSTDKKTSSPVDVTVATAVEIDSVTISSSKTAVNVNEVFTLTATASPSGLTGVKYTFYKDGVAISDATDITSNTYKTKITAEGSAVYTVSATLNGKTVNSATPVTVTAEIAPVDKEVTIYFKSSSASAYVPSLSVDGSAPAVMTRNKQGEANSTYFGSTYSGSLKFYWFYTTMTIDASKEHTLTFTTKDNRVNAKKSYTFSAAEGNNYYFAVNNLMGGDTEVIDLTGEPEYIRNYHISATHMVHSTTYDNNVGFTWINGKEYAMGSYLKDNVTAQAAASLLTIPSALNPNAMLQASSTEFFTIKSATLAQKITAEMEEVSTLQYQLLDVNLDGKVDIKDSTMMQKALAGF